MAIRSLGKKDIAFAIQQLLLVAGKTLLATSFILYFLLTASQFQGKPRVQDIRELKAQRLNFRIRFFSVLTGQVGVSSGFAAEESGDHTETDHTGILQELAIAELNMETPKGNI